MQARDAEISFGGQTGVGRIFFTGLIDYDLVTLTTDSTLRGRLLGVLIRATLTNAEAPELRKLASSQQSGGRHGRSGGSLT